MTADGEAWPERHESGNGWPSGLLGGGAEKGEACRIRAFSIVTASLLTN